MSSVDWQEENRRKREEFFVERYVGGQIVRISFDGKRCELVIRRDDGREYDLIFYGYARSPLGVTWKKTPVLV